MSRFRRLFRFQEDLELLGGEPSLELLGGEPSHPLVIHHWTLVQVVHDRHSVHRRGL